LNARRTSRSKPLTAHQRQARGANAGLAMNSLATRRLTNTVVTRRSMRGSHFRAAEQRHTEQRRVRASPHRACTLNTCRRRTFIDTTARSTSCLLDVALAGIYRSEVWN
jgi:hypothetical protein